MVKIANTILLVAWLGLAIFLIASTGWIVGSLLGAISFVITAMIIVTVDP